MENASLPCDGCEPCNRGEPCANEPLDAEKTLQFIRQKRRETQLVPCAMPEPDPCLHDSGELTPEAVKAALRKTREHAATGAQHARTVAETGSRFTRALKLPPR